MSIRHIHKLSPNEENKMDFFNVVKHMVFDNEYNPIEGICEVTCPNCKSIQVVSRDGWSAIKCIDTFYNKGCGAVLHCTDFNLDEYYTHGIGDKVFVYFQGEPIFQVDSTNIGFEKIKTHFLERNPRYKNNQFFDDMAYDSFYGL